MTATEKLLAQVEASLLQPGLGVAEAATRLDRWIAMGVRQVVTTPFLMGELDASSYPEVAFAGAVSFPAGGSTLASKRMELLECVRLGARAATVVLTPALVAARAVSALEKEMAALLSTAPELQVRFLVDCARQAPESLEVLIRLLKGVHPTHLVTADGVYSSPAGPESVRWLRARLTRKVRVAAGAFSGGPPEARTLLEAGADLLVTAEPEALREEAP